MSVILRSKSKVQVLLFDPAITVGLKKCYFEQVLLFDPAITVGLKKVLL